MEAFYEEGRDTAQNELELFTTGGCLPHFHGSIELLCVESGEIDVSINGVTRRLHGGEIAFASAYDVHSYTQVVESAVGYVLILPQKYLASYHAATKNQAPVEHFISSPTVYADVHALFLMLRSRLSEANEAFNSGAVGAILGILSRAVPYAPRADSDKNNTVREILAYLAAHFDEPLTLDGLAQRFGYTPNHFSHIFNSYLSVNLKDYLNNLRVEHSAALLKEGKNVIDAAMDSGFTSMRTFYRVFSKRYGCTPQRYLQPSSPPKDALLCDLRDALPAFTVERFDRSRAKEVYRLLLTNPDYILDTGDKPSEERCAQGIEAVPPGCRSWQKLYCGLSVRRRCVAVCDAVQGYPSADCLYIGLLMVDGNLHRRGIGSAVLAALTDCARKRGLTQLQLGCIEENQRGYAYWRGQGFEEVRRVEQVWFGKKHRIICLKKSLM